MRTWCVSLTKHGSSKPIVHDFIHPAFVLESGKSLRHPHTSVPCVPSLSLLPFPYTQVSVKKLGLIHISRSKCCANSISVDLLEMKGHFSLSLFFLMSPTWIPKHFQHHTWKHWWMRNYHKSCVSVYSSAQHVLWVQSLYLKHTPGKETKFGGLLHTVTWY